MPARLRSRLPQIAAALDPRVDAAVRVGAERIAQRASERAPDAPPIGEGLVEAIHVEDSDQSAGYLVVAGDDEVFWGHFVEFGTSHSGAQPFLIPAAEESKTEVVQLVSGALRRL